jgi:hypothetical protein
VDPAEAVVEGRPREAHRVEQRKHLGDDEPRARQSFLEREEDVGEQRIGGIRWGFLRSSEKFGYVNWPAAVGYRTRGRTPASILLGANEG